jgi:hypothetical protein
MQGTPHAIVHTAKRERDAAMSPYRKHYRLSTARWLLRLHLMLKIGGTSTRCMKVPNNNRHVNYCQFVIAKAVVEASTYPIRAAPGGYKLRLRQALLKGVKLQHGCTGKIIPA